jgi:hypothetical protein
MEVAHDAVLAELGREVGERLLLALQVEEERRVRVDAGRWRYSVGIDGDAAAIVGREERQW